MQELKDGFTDAIYVHTGIHYDWKDRLRILFGKTARVSIVTQTENLPGQVETVEVSVSVAPIFRNPFRRKTGFGDVSVNQ